MGLLVSRLDTYTRELRAIARTRPTLMYEFPVSFRFRGKSRTYQTVMPGATRRQAELVFRYRYHAEHFDQVTVHPASPAEGTRPYNPFVLANASGHVTDSEYERRVYEDERRIRIRRTGPDLSGLRFASERPALQA